MSSTAQPAQSSSRDSLRSVAIFAIAAGGISALGFFLYAGRTRYPGAVVILGFSAWILSPFVLLAFGEFLSKRWAVGTQRALHILAIALTLATLIIYGVLAFGPPRAKMVPIFVLVPPVSCISIAVVISTAALAGRRNGSGPKR